MSNPALEEWLLEDISTLPGAVPPTNVAAPPTPDMNPMPQQPDLNQAPPNPTEQEPELPDVSSDPIAPDMPEQMEEQDFETWKDSYSKETVKGDVNKLIDMIHQVRDLDLDAYPRKFVEDNLQVLFLQQNANIGKAAKEIRKLTKDQFDANNPAVSLVNYLNQNLETMPELNNIFIKMKGLLGAKADYHRKFLASLLGAIQVGSGGNNEDIVFNETEYSVKISTRFHDQWGMMDIGKWAMREDDPERHLTEPEQRRLEEGSPEEKEVIRRRLVIESIAETFKKRSFIAHVVGTDGTIYNLGWDLSGSLRAAYTEGKLVVRTNQSQNSEAMIDDNGAIVPLVDLKIKYIKETGGTDEDGKPEREEHDFVERIDGLLFLTARLPILREAASSFQGIVLKETPYSGNPSDLRVLQRCVPSAAECLLRQC